MNKYDIKKALKFCADSNDCDDCPYDVVRSCSDRLKLDARELIAEQEKEIERLKDEDTRLTEKLKQVLLAVDTVKEMTAMCNIDKQNAEIERLKAENEQLKVKLEKNPLAIKQKIMEEDDYELTEREQATLFLDRMGSDVEILHDIVENLDELLGKGINEYIMGIDGVEGIKDMWERSAVMELAEKVKAKSYVNNYCREVVEIEKIDELLKEYE